MSLASSSTSNYSTSSFVLSPPTTNSGTLASGQNLPEKTPLGRVTATGELKEVDLAAADGSEQVIGFLIYAVDASGGAAKCQYYSGGEFNQDEVNWHASFNSQAKKDIAFDGTPITLKTLG